MSNRRTPRHPNPDLERLSVNLNDKLEALFQSLESLRRDITIVQKDVRFEAQQRQALASDLQHLASQISQVRDAVSMERSATIEHTAKAAAQETLPVVQRAVKRAQRPANWKSWVALVTVAFVGLATFAEKAPHVLGFIERAWIAAKGDES